MAREFSQIGVVGLGTMGAGIAELFARNGFDVIGVETDEAAAARGRGHLEHSTARAVQRGKLDADAQRALLDRITVTTSMDDLVDADLVVEAVPERLELKAAVLRRLDAVCRADVVLASNTSSLSVTELSVQTASPGRVVGVHFFNPAPVMRLVEVIRTVVTEPDVLADVSALAARLGKSPVVIGDRAGFIANALLFGYLNHAVRMLESRYASREDLDTAMKLGCGYPMGPLALIDLIGLDTAYEILDTMYHQSRNRLHAPAPLLKQMITAGFRGRKSGRGFYTYAAPDSQEVVPDVLTPTGTGTTPEGVTPRAVDAVGVVGTGTMATGIAEVFARAGHEVVIHGRSTDSAEAAEAAVRASLERAVTRGKMDDAEREQALARITTTTAMEDLGHVDLVVEAVKEDLEVKRSVFAALDRVCKIGAILATATSSLPVVECAAATTRPGDVVGLHFFNPAPVMKLVEVVHTISTSADVIATAEALCAELGRSSVTCSDRAGFIVNALLFPYLNDAVSMLEAHYATADDIDTAMKLGCGMPMGPFELLDVVGLDVSLVIQRTLYLEFREAGFAPAPLLEHLVTAGRLGRKTGKGFRDHS